ncbi:hypothetical protein E1B28_006792 [Marasmius oreades]|uniref:Uncharacterized protein n=1 Tax=Marasmius oreades TaxID=181124 RepID=A0A9P8AB65_9AGAR|nr:uncharacterized protein E1B28_006792 [Marasmius oreades]KAG7096118.1 hypothetical protein E1B28_006792 [Marasmius oreades]
MSSGDTTLRNVESPRKNVALSVLFKAPSTEEAQACWELCRLHNNIGFWVVWLPTAWSIAMAYNAQRDIAAINALQTALLYVPLCFGMKSLIMTVDDILDRDIDLLVERTKNRPLPRGSISPERAWLFFSAQLSIGMVLAIQYLDKTSLQIAILIFPIYIIYPTCKRWTNLAPIPLGFMFNVGVFMGWSYLSAHTVPWHVLLPVYLGACLWTFTYETIYQHQDKVDDVKIGLYSPALLLGSWTIPICACTGLLFFIMVTYSGFLNNQGIAFFVGVAYAGSVLFRKLRNTNIDIPEDCKQFFLLNVKVGQIILGALVIDSVYNRFSRP